MWLSRKKDKDHPSTVNVAPTISSPIGPPFAIPLDSDFTTINGTKKEGSKSFKEPKTDKGTGIRKRILQLGARVHSHNFGSSFTSTNENDFTTKELMQLEETKNRLFPSQTNLQLPSLKVNATSLASSQFSPSMSSESASSTTAADFAFDTPKEFNVPGLSLPALAVVQVDVRELVLHRHPLGGFGFKIRRIQYPLSGSDNSNEFCSVVFAEPIEMRQGPPRPSDLATGLLPGDQLLEVNGRLVNEMTRDELLNEIEESGEKVLIKVRAMPELTEFCRQGASGSNGNFDETAEDALQFEGIANNGVGEEISDEDRYWLIHSRGFTICQLLERLLDGKVRIRVNLTETIVDSSDVDHANSTSLDRIGDIAALKYLNETSVIHLLRQRYGANLLYTNGGIQNLIYISRLLKDNAEPSKLVGHNDAANLLRLFRGLKRSQMPAHIYAMVQQVYRNLRMTNRPQSVVFTGFTGSGKSLQLRTFLYYLCNVAFVAHSKVVSFGNLSGALDVFEAFGNCVTHFNLNSSRFVELLSLTFNPSVHLCAAKFQSFLLETSRLTPTAEKERTFYIFYYLWEGCDLALREKLRFETIEEPFIYKHSQRLDCNYKTKWSQFLQSLTQIGFTTNQIDGICEILGVIFHLSFAGATQSSATKSSFIRFSNAEIAANLLGITFEQLSQAVFLGGIPSNTTSYMSPGKASINRFSMSNRVQSGQEALNSFIQALYSELFSSIGIFINKFFGQNEGGHSMQVNILDVPGGNFSSAKTEISSSDSLQKRSLSDLVFNYTNERINELIYNANFVDPVELYAREQVNVLVEKPLASPIPIVRLLDKKQQLLNCVDVERRSCEQRGLFYILEEESMFPGASDDSFFERIFIHLEQNRLIHRHPRNRLQFVLGHCLNTSPTVYSVVGWLKQAQPNQNTLIALPQLLQSSSKNAISELFTITGISHSTSTVCKLRRSTQAVQICDSGHLLGGFFSNIASQIDYFLNAISRQSRLHFVHCLQPQHPQMSAISAGRPKAIGSSVIGESGRVDNSSTNANYSDVLDISYVRQQIRPIFFIDSVRVNSRGYPERMAFRDFRRRFQCLIESNNGQSSGNKAISLDETLDDRNYVQKILERMDIYEHRYRLGLSQILLRNDVFIELEEKRDLSLSGLITELQRQCRNCLARKWLSKRRVQEVAIKCIQRNASLNLRLRHWPWWNLYVRILPLLSIAKNDGEQRECRQKIAILEATITELKSLKLKLEGELAELEQHLKAECQTSRSLSLNLEQESQERIRLEAKLRQQTQQLQQLQQQVQSESGESIAQKEKSNVQELDWEYHERTIELKADLSKMQAHELSLKLKNQKATEQLLDLQAEMENLRSRNEQLEKRQKNEVKTVKEEINEIMSEKMRLEKQCFDLNLAASRRNAEVLSLKEDNADMRSNLTKARRELDEISEANINAGGFSEDEVLQLRKSKREYESKLAEIENELENTIQRNQVLEQNVTRLEMGAERLRSDLQRADDAKETEITEMRAQFQRRLRTFEEQINELTDTNASLLKQNRVLESRTRQLDSSSQASSVDISGSSQHYKRELRKAVALLRDTQSVLAYERESAPNHSLVRQLKEQLEDVEAAKLAALKSRHTLENELVDLRNQLDLANSMKSAAEDKVLALMREKNSANTLAEEHNEQLQELLKKYKAQIQQSHIDSITLEDQLERIGNLERAKQRLQEQLNEAAASIEFNKLHTVEKHKIQLLELKLRDVQAKLDLETSHKLRYESIVAKLKEEIECLQEQIMEAKSAKEREIETARKLKKEAQVHQEQINELKKRETELVHRFKLSKSNCEKLTEEHQKTIADLKLAMRRIDALQVALNADLTAGSDIEEEDEHDFDDTNNDVKTDSKILDREQMRNSASPSFFL